MALSNWQVKGWIKNKKQKMKIVNDMKKLSELPWRWMMFLTGFIVVAIIAVIILGPIAIIWSLNTLFPVLAIPFTWKTWTAIWLLTLLTASARYKNSNSN